MYVCDGLVATRTHHGHPVAVLLPGVRAVLVVHWDAGDERSRVPTPIEDNGL
jgi:hypothetical protein